MSEEYKISITAEFTSEARASSAKNKTWMGSVENEKEEDEERKKEGRREESEKERRMKGRK